MVKTFAFISNNYFDRSGMEPLAELWIYTKIQGVFGESDPKIIQ